MENRLNIIIIVVVILLINSCITNDSVANNCNTEKSLATFIGADSNWIVVREAGEFLPIIGLKVFESKLWVSTYGSDYFPAKIKVGLNSFLIENIQFRRSLPVKKDNDPAELVSVYKNNEVVFLISISPGSCEIKNELQVDILNISGKGNETLKFVKPEE